MIKWDLLQEGKDGSIFTNQSMRYTILGFPGGSDGKESACNAGDLSLIPWLIPGLGRFPEKGNGYPLQYSCLENSMNRGTWQVQSMGLQRVRHD